MDVEGFQTTGQCPLLRFIDGKDVLFSDGQRIADRCCTVDKPALSTQVVVYCGQTAQISRVKSEGHSCVHGDGLCSSRNVRRQKQSATGVCLFIPSVRLTLESSAHDGAWPVSLLHGAWTAG